jgi:hypothetical protein
MGATVGIIPQGFLFVFEGDFVTKPFARAVDEAVGWFFQGNLVTDGFDYFFTLLGIYHHQDDAGEGFNSFTDHYFLVPFFLSQKW